MFISTEFNGSTLGPPSLHKALSNDAAGAWHLIQETNDSSVKLPMFCPLSVKGSYRQSIIVAKDFAEATLPMTEGD